MQVTSKSQVMFKSQASQVNSTDMSACSDAAKCGNLMLQVITNEAFLKFLPIPGLPRRLFLNSISV